MWIHKKFVSPLCKPPSTLKGQFAYHERKFTNLYMIYGAFGTAIPTVLGGLVTGYAGIERVIFVFLTIAVQLFLIWMKQYKSVTYLSTLSLAASLFVYWKSPHQLEAFYVPTYALVTLSGMGASRSSLTLIACSSCYMVWFHAQPKMKSFFQSASKEEIDEAIQKSVIVMIRMFVNMFLQVLVKSCLQEKMYQKWATLKKKIAEQNEALTISNEKLQDAVNSREEFILSFSHETRNPLNGLVGNLQILNDMNLPLNVRQLVNKASICTKILKNIILTILDSKKSGHSAVDMHLMATSINMKVFIEEVSTVCKDLIQGKGLLPIIEVSPSFPNCVAFDPERMTQVILNLVGNAIKFTQKGSITLSFAWNPEKRTEEGLITQFSTALDIPYPKEQTYKQQDFSFNFKKIDIEEKGQLIISVTDTGNGIKKEHQETIFQKFAQLNDRTELKRLGLGLGLWISKTIVNLHKGEIFIDSTEGVGSRFTVAIPTVCVSVATADQTNDTKSYSTAHYMRALVVEDCPINQVISTEMLQKYGFRDIEIASNGKEAIEIFKKKEPNFFDLITMDLEMPVMKGKDAIIQIRQFEQRMMHLPTKIAIISGNAIEKEIKECTDPTGKIRADAFLPKPCDYKTLATTLKKFGFEQGKTSHQLGKKVKVLFADDDFFNLDVMKNFASQLGVDYFVAKNGQEAVEVFKGNSSEIQMVFLDCEMPIMNGLDACLEIKEIMKKVGKSCPVYLVSGIDQKDNIPTGFDGYTQKPFNFETFKKILGKPF